MEFHDYFSEDEPRTVEVKVEQVSIKTITLEDISSKSRVTLWRDTSTAGVRPGDHVLITDVVVNMYQNKASLSTTSKTKLEVCEYFIFSQTYFCTN